MDNFLLLRSVGFFIFIEDLKLGVVEENSTDEDREYLKGIRQSRDYAEEQFDKLVVYLASGGLVLTIGFVKDIVEITSVTNTTFLKITWIGFVLTLLVSLISQRTSVKAMDFVLEGDEINATLWNKATNKLNNSSIALLILSILSFIIFIWNKI